MKETDLIKPEIVEKYSVGDDVLKEFGLYESNEAYDKMRESNINSFHEIGWIDPFPAKDPMMAMKKGKVGKKMSKTKTLKDVSKLIKRGSTNLDVGGENIYAEAKK